MFFLILVLFLLKYIMYINIVIEWFDILIERKKLLIVVLLWSWEIIFVYKLGGCVLLVYFLFRFDLRKKGVW